jgi:hypothetical protein
MGEGESIEARKPPPARLPGLAAVLTPLRSLLRPGTSSGRSARRPPVTWWRSRHAGGPFQSPQTGHIPPQPTALLSRVAPCGAHPSHGVGSRASGHARQRAPPQPSGDIAPLYRIFDRAEISGVERFRKWQFRGAECSNGGSFGGRVFERWQSRASSRSGLGVLL